MLLFNSVIVFQRLLYLCLNLLVMENTQVKLLNSLAKKIKAEKRDKEAVILTLQSAKILTKSGNFSSNFINLNKIFVSK